jgi:hydrophobe/amphiphile efflux-1 (HAE1) family protein
MNISRFFIDRPVFAAVISIVIIIAGALAVTSLPIAQYPEIAPPTVTVSAVYPGANAQVVADTVAAPIEEQVNGVENMLYMSSNSTNNGTMRLTVTFKVGTNLDIAQVQVQNRVAIAQPELPPEVQQEGIVVKKASPDITMVVQLYSPDGRYDPLFISNYATLQVRDELFRLPGVGDITVFGVRDYSMRLWLNPGEMSSRSITTGDVIAAVQQQNVQVAGGQVGGPPLPPGQAPFTLTVNALGRLTTPEQFKDMVVKTGADGRISRMRDIARVELGAADYTTGAMLSGQPCVGLALFQLPGTNAITTRDAVYAKMNQLAAKFPPGLVWKAPYDTTVFVRDSIHDVIETLLIGVGLVAIVVLVFLQSWRAALVPMVAVPVSLIGTFAALWLCGFSLNMLSLFGLVLAIGIVVDDAIVVVENVERWIEHGLTPRDAAFRAMDEVTPAVIAIAFGLSAVFIPVAFVSGITGQFYRQFALTISFSTLLSAFNSLTLSPALAALLLKPKGARPDWFTRLINLILGWFFHLFNRGLEGTTAAYAATLKHVVRLAVLVLLIYGGLLVLTYFGFRTVPTGFIPSQDQGYLLMNLQMPDATSIDRTEATLKKLSDIAMHTPGVSATTVLSGYSLLTGANSTASGTMFIILAPFSERDPHPDQSGHAILAQLTAKFRGVQDGLAIVLPSPPVRGIGSAGGFKLEVEDRSGLASAQDLQAQVTRLATEAAKRPELTSLFSGYRAGVPQLYANLNRTMARQQNVNVTDVFQTLQVFLGGYYINDFNYLGRVWHVMAQADAPFRADAASVGQLYSRNVSGAMVPLGAIMDLKDMIGPDRVSHYDLYNAAELNGNSAFGISSGQAMQVMSDVANKVLPDGYSFEWTDIAYQEDTAGNTAIFIFPLCILFVWLTHSAEYESFALSSAIILIVPMCLLCGIAGVWARGMDDNIFTQIGFVVLAGMSVKNAVLIVEFAKQQQEHDPTLSASAAAVEAARLRLRPIVMTSFAFIFGVLPLITAAGAGSEMRQALGTVVFFGMIGVTFFGLFLTPVFYTSIRWITNHLSGHSASQARADPPPTMPPEQPQPPSISQG